MSMKVNRIIALRLMPVAVIIGFASCSKKSSSKSASRATGWNVDSKMVIKQVAGPGFFVEEELLRW
jgi:hypothetical protein